MLDGLGFRTRVPPWLWIAASQWLQGGAWNGRVEALVALSPGITSRGSINSYSP